MDELFKKIVEIPSISGKEEDLQKFIDRHLQNSVDNIQTDVLGNNIKTIGNGKIRVMLEAHADEVGFIITYVDKNGYAYFQPLGGVKKDITIGQKVKVFTTKGKLSGVIGRDPEKQITNASPTKDMWIDTGASEESNHIQVGDMAFFDTYFEDLQNDCVIARGADNKVGVYATTEIIKEFAKNPNKSLTLQCALTTQEELGMFGATVAVDEIKPKYAFIIETTDATDTPEAKIEENGKRTIGKGPIITFSPKTDNALFTLFKKTAEENNIPLQIIAQAKETSTDTDVIQSSNTGVITMLISIAVRYMHTPAVLFSWKDVKNTITLINAVLQKLGN